MGTAPCNCVQKVRSSFLAGGQGEALFLPGPVIRLSFEADADPVETMNRLLAGQCFRHAEELKAHYSLPSGRRLCVEISPAASTLAAGGCQETAGCDGLDASRKQEELYHAAVLGMCSAHVYDPARPILWTAARLCRAVQLFQSNGYYSERLP